MQGKFRVILRNGFDMITTMIVQNTIFTTYFVLIDSFDSWTFPLEGEAEKKSVETRSREQCRANSELSFEMGSTLSLQWLCKIPFSQLTSFEVKVLIAERFHLERQEKKSVEPRSREQSRANSELSFELGSKLSLQWFCKIPFSEPSYFEPVLGGSRIHSFVL